MLHCHFYGHLFLAALVALGRVILSLRKSHPPYTSLPRFLATRLAAAFHSPSTRR